jgi:hypothetical protein
LSGREKKALYEEMQAQTERLLAAGIRPTHLDSHHHVHTEWAIAPLICRLASAYGIQRIRLTRNMGPGGIFPKRLYGKIFNRWYLGQRTGFANTDYFGDIQDIKSFSRAGLAGSRPPDGLSFEIMVHPLFDENRNLVDLDRTDLQQELLPILEHWSRPLPTDS